MPSTLLTTTQILQSSALATRTARGVDTDTLELYIDSADSKIIQAVGPHPVVDPADSQAVQDRKNRDLARRKVELLRLVNLQLNDDTKNHKVSLRRKLRDIGVTETSN